MDITGKTIHKFLTAGQWIHEGYNMMIHKFLTAEVKLLK